MVQIIAGAKGKGKTKYLLDMANTAVKEAKGSVVYLDKSSKHMYELNNQIRLINVQEYPIDTSDGFIGFICGIICQDHDLEQMYLDSFLKLACLEGADAALPWRHGELRTRFSGEQHCGGRKPPHRPDGAKESVVVSL